MPKYIDVYHKPTNSFKQELVFTKKDIDKAVQDERDACINDGYRDSSNNTPKDMCEGETLRAYSKGQDNFAAAIRNRGTK